MVFQILISKRFCWRGIQLSRLQLRGDKEPIKRQTYANRGRVRQAMPIFAYIFFQMKNLLNKILAILTRFCVIFIKIPVLLLKCVSHKNFFLCSFGIELNRIVEFPLKRNMLLPTQIFGYALRLLRPYLWQPIKF